ncbi:50S ribosomal protein L23 [Candidatus Falkowbacteria bacterium CG10_big_fil_rev_8_21_14_0_10_38_22]|uniref:Large ribosomal subunit protein uL23 n=1 Tax=Candidatus Falkowbacteria bacterium CG10_big_fil_rev_8_21_14_0_10_38_22 TaxID=1974564 RepID=A0A2M6WPU1_9BACT|nr:50S ribosomal protein L23 [Candidatus Falkowbacteria bacterium]PIT94815.1 MAG: 50S ribosomal protein L23 [Candidatus Falkowbacteria bacterium CG10_big_fil_rev_8_21_14_0_10_38_22]
MKDLYSSAEQVKTKEEKGPGKKIFKYQQAPKILVRPLVTEKVSNLGADNKYVFAVAVRANKVEVAKAIQQVYGIKPIKVNIINMAGKKARYGRITGRRKDWKKAIVTLAAGQTIKVYEGV